MSITEKGINLSKVQNTDANGCITMSVEGFFCMEIIISTINLGR